MPSGAAVSGILAARFGTRSAFVWAGGGSLALTAVLGVALARTARRMA